MAERDKGGGSRSTGGACCGKEGSRGMCIAQGDKRGLSMGQDGFALGVVRGGFVTKGVEGLVGEAPL